MLVAVGAFCSASHKEEEFQLLIIPQLKSENMLSFKKSLANQMSSVKATKYLVYGALIAGGVEMIRRNFFASSAANPVTTKEHSDLLKRVGELEQERDTLKGRVDGLEAGRVIPPAQWLPWIKAKTVAFGKKVNEWVPNWVSSIAKMYLLSQATSIVLGKVQVPRLIDIWALIPRLIGVCLQEHHS